MVNILVLGNGAREQAIYEIISNSNKNKVYIYDINKFDNIKLFCLDNDIQLVIPSKEEYLCNGIVDYLQKEISNIRVFGPNKNQSQIEGSKYFSKNLMDILEIPTPLYIYYPCLESFHLVNPLYDVICKKNPPVLKYSGLANGKGVYLPNNNNEIESDLNDIFKLGNEGIIIEERLYGTEVSILAFCNGEEGVLMPQTQDYKRIYDGDKGPNTGGMGAISPANILSEIELSDVKIHIDKVVKYLNYKGILYAGLMKTNNGVYFLEFNCRFGDPEAQVILNLLDSDLLNIIFSCIQGKDIEIKWKKKYASVVVLSHNDYPISKLNKPVQITYNEPIIDKTIKIYESNVININDKKCTTGGRVISMVSIDNTLQDSLKNIYNNIYKIQYDGSYYRRDIGCNNIIKNPEKTINIGILASGNGTSIEKLLQDKSELVKIIVLNKRYAKVIEKAQKYNIPFFYIPQKNISNNDYYEKIVNVLRIYNIEFLILSGFMKIVPEIIFNEFFTVNIHPSLLPKYKGLMDLNVHKCVIENKEKFSGCTLHRVTRVVDSGEILMQKQCKLSDTENEYSLKEKIQKLEKECILEYVNNYINSITKVNYDINVEEGNAFVEELKKTNDKIGGFCANFEHKNITFAGSADGCGSKLDLANRYNMLDKIGIDLVAMNVNDLIAGGAKPLFFMDYIALDLMDRIKCNNIIKGINKGCSLANCKLIGGETAEMKGIYLKNKLDLAGFAFGEVEYKLPIKQKMNNMCNLYGLSSSGIHSNGYTLINKLIEKNQSNSMPEIEEILTPTRIYTNVIEFCNCYKENILGISHITGGGFKDNLSRILPNNLTYELIDWDFPSIFKWIQKESNLTRDEMLNTFNCGYGMVIICNKILDINDKFFQDNNLDLTLIGKLVNI